MTDYILYCERYNQTRSILEVQALMQFGINVRQTSVCRQSFDKLKLVGHQTPSPPTPLACS
ncbi:MAG TPA: hypothetical protein VHQ95_04165, partial [Pyrinomonadaceae bacterium]|nr:hypothetical protein [Pyrinomonadaceae bacterium]